MASPATALALCLALFFLLPFSFSRPLAHRHALHSTFSRSPFLHRLSLPFLPHHYDDPSAGATPDPFLHDPEFFNEPFSEDDADVLDGPLSPLAQRASDEAYLFDDPEYFNEEAFRIPLDANSILADGSFADE